MNRVVGNLIVAVSIILLFLSYILYVINIEFLGETTVNYIVSAFIAGILVLSVVLYGLLMRDFDSSPY